MRCPEWKLEAAPSADSIVATQICRCIVSAVPSWVKSCWSKYLLLEGDPPGMFLARVRGDCGRALLNHQICDARPHFGKAIGGESH